MQTNSELAEYERTCNILCNSAISTERTQAEMLLFEYISNFQHLSKIEQLLLETNDIYAVFVTFEYLGKKIAATEIPDEDHKTSQIIVENRTIYLKILEMALNFAAKRSEFLSKSLTLNSTAYLIGLLIKKLWVMMENPSALIEKFESSNGIHQAPRIELFRMKVFEYVVTNVSTQSSSNSYLSYRKNMIDFQCTGLYDIYRQSEELLGKILSISSQNNISGLDDKLLTDIISQILQNMFLCLHFNFNMSYFEFETELDAYDLTIVCFPEKWAEFVGKFSTLENLGKIFFHYYMLNTDICLKCLRCMTRIAASRLSIFPQKPQRKTFIINCYKIALDVTKLSFQKPKQDYFIDIAELNLRIVNTNIRKLRKLDTFTGWLQLLLDWTLKLLEIPIVISDPLVPKLIDLWKKLRRQIKSEEKKFGDFIHVVNKSISTILNRLLRSLLDSASEFFKDLNYNTHKRFKKTLKVFFQYLPEMLPNNTETLRLIDEEITKCAMLFENMVQNMTKTGFDDLIYKICMLISIADYGVLPLTAMDNTSEQMDEEESKLKGMILAKILNLIQYVSNLPTENSLNVILDLSILCYISHYFDLTLNSLDTLADDTRIECKSKVFQVSVPFLGSNDFSKVIELLLIKVMKNLTITDVNILSFSILLLRAVLLKLKTYVPRDKFENLPIVTAVTNVFQNLERTSLKNNKYYKFRTKIFEIVAIMYLDDYYDNYLMSTQKICADIYKSNIANATIITPENLIKYFRDISGLSNYIDTIKIYKYFFKTCYETVIKLIFECLPKHADNNELVLAIFDLLNSLIQNKGQRIAADPNSLIPYELFKDYSRILQSNRTMLSNLLKISVGSDSFDIEIKILSKLMKIFNSFFKEKIINFSVFQFFGDSSFLEFLADTCEILTAYSKCMVHFPKYIETFIDNLLVFADPALEIVFRYAYKIMVKVLELTFDTFQRLNEGKIALKDKGGYSEMVIISKIGTIIKSVFSFAYSEINFHDSDEIKLNINQFLRDTEELVAKFYIFSFDTMIMSENLETRTQQIIMQNLFCMTVAYNKLFEDVKMGFIKNYAKTEAQVMFISKVFDDVVKGVENKFTNVNIEKFTKNLKTSVKILSKITQTKSFEFLNDMDCS